MALWSNHKFKDNIGIQTTLVKMKRPNYLSHTKVMKGLRVYIKIKKIKTYC